MTPDVHPKITVVESTKTLSIDGKPFSSHEILGKIGSGANGIVYRARNKLLDRDEAVKVWTKLRPNDQRDKLEQGILEARKMAAANKMYAVEIFSLSLIGNTPVAAMEYVPGVDLRKFMRGGCKNEDFYNNQVLCKNEFLWETARLYLNAIDLTSTSKSVHGDPHLSNVLMYKDEQKNTRIKLCDFGTSIFTGKKFSEERHWRIVEESVFNITRSFKNFEFAKNKLPRFKEMALVSITHKNIVAPLRDYLSCLEMEFYE